MLGRGVGRALKRNHQLVLRVCMCWCCRAGARAPCRCLVFLLERMSSVCDADELRREEHLVSSSSCVKESLEWEEEEEEEEEEGEEEDEYAAESG